MMLHHVAGFSLPLLRTSINGKNHEYAFVIARAEAIPSPSYASARNYARYGLSSMDYGLCYNFSGFV
ncbi:MAG: hypothetical protein ACTHMI_12065 [Mucilaginibacter sp.]